MYVHEFLALSLSYVQHMCPTQDHPRVFEKIGHLITNTSYISQGDPDILEVFKLPTTPVTACCTPSDEQDYSSSGETSNSAWTILT